MKLLLDQYDRSRRRTLDQVVPMDSKAKLKTVPKIIDGYKILFADDVWRKCTLPVVISADFIAAGDQFGCIDFT